MKFSHAWLAELVDLPADPLEVGRLMTAVGVPFEGFTGDASRPDSLVYEFEVFSNRPDCMNHLGLAREIAAALGRPLRRPPTEVTATGPPTASRAAVAIEAPRLCRRYTARLVLGVRVAPSPDWLRSRLERLGHRAINNVVDATNYVLWEMGQPLHPFDFARFEGGRVVVREARPGEVLTTLDGVERRLTPERLVIADARMPVALAGVMGGRASEIGPTTHDVLLESAWFDPVSVRRTAKALGLHTDASHRFERGADPEAAPLALDRAAALIARLTGGEVTTEPIDVHPGPQAPRTATLRPSRARALLGLDPGAAAMRLWLERLEFEVVRSDADALTVRVPSFRRDIESEVDLIEEVARQGGYDAIPSLLPRLDPADVGRPEAARRLQAARRALRHAGLSEAVNLDLVEADECLLFEPDIRPPAVLNPLHSEGHVLRTTLLPGLLRNAAHNLRHGLPGAHLFEIGRVFRPSPEGPVESERAAAVFAGQAPGAHWSAAPRGSDLFDAKGAFELLAEALALSPLRFASDRIPAPGALAGLTIESGGALLGRVGEVSGAACRRYELEVPVFALELDLGPVLETATAERHFRPLPRVPGVRRDLAIVVGEAVTVEAIEETVKGASPLPIAGLVVFDRYRGRGVPDGSASVALQIHFQHPERTLEAAEVQAAHTAIVAALGERLGARLRGPEPA
jgi:phenylalanyl-tRNA synthetase beta chain